MKTLKYFMAAAATVALATAVVAVPQTQTHTTYRSSHVEQVQPSYWRGFLNALDDMNPFTSSLGHNWAETHQKVEGIYEEMHREAKRRVDELKEDAMLKDHAALQSKIADIYAEAASEAEERIEKLKRPIMASMMKYYKDTGVDTTGSTWGSTASSTIDTAGRAKGLYDSAKNKVGEAYAGVKEKLMPHEEHSLFEDTSKKISNVYRRAVDSTKKDIVPRAGETWQDAKLRAQKAYDEIMHKSHHEARGILGTLRDKFGIGVHSAASAAEWVAVKTWHLILHSMLATFWMAVGAAAFVGGKAYWDRRVFNKQLTSNVSGPVVLQKQMWLTGTDDSHRKFQEYWINAANFFKAQAGFRKCCLERGIGVGGSVYNWTGEFNTIGDLRRALAKPELNELKLRMPKPTLSMYRISSVLQSDKIDSTEGSDSIRAGGEGLRQRVGGPGLVH